jgi:hypothetical protein
MRNGDPKGFSGDASRRQTALAMAQVNLFFGSGYFFVAGFSVDASRRKNGIGHESWRRQIIITNDNK